MLRLAIDEDFDDRIVRGNPRLDAVTVREAGLQGRTDPEVSAWAARERRVLLTHDVNT